MLPGSLHDPKTFVRPYQEEASCAAYNGFSDVGTFQTLLVTPAVLSHSRGFRAVSKGMSGFTSLELLRDDLARIESTLYSDVEETWPIDDESDDKLNVAFRMAWIIASLRRQLTTDASVPRDQFEVMLGDEGKLFRIAHGMDLPSSDEIHPVSLSVLGFPEESALETFNRVFCILKYLQHVVTASRLWEIRFGKENWNEERLIADESVPGWMRERQPGPELTTIDEVQALGSLNSKPWSIHGKRHSKFPGKLDMDEHLEETGATLPTFVQRLDADSRLHSSTAMWRDCIRRQYNCRSLGLTIHSLHLRYVPKGDPDEEQLTSLLKEDWKNIPMLLDLHKLERDAPIYFASLERDAGLKPTDQEVKEGKSAKVKLDRSVEQKESSTTRILQRLSSKKKPPLLQKSKAEPKRDSVIRFPEMEDADAGNDEDEDAETGDNMSVAAKMTAAMAMGRKAQQKAEVKRKIDMGATEVEDANAGIEGGNTDAGVPTTASKKLRIDASADGSTGP